MIIIFLVYINGVIQKLCHIQDKVYEKYPRIFIYTLHLQHFTMETKTLVIAAVIVAVTATFALAPLVSSAMALRNGGSVSTTTCVHNGNGRTTSCPPTGSSSTPITTTTYKCQGKFQSTPCT